MYYGHLLDSEQDIQTKRENHEQFANRLFALLCVSTLGLAFVPGVTGKVAIAGQMMVNACLGFLLYDDLSQQKKHLDHFISELRDEPTQEKFTKEVGKMARRKSTVIAGLSLNTLFTLFDMVKMAAGSPSLLDVTAVSIGNTLSILSGLYHHMYAKEIMDKVKVPIQQAIDEQREDPQLSHSTGLL